MITSKSQVSSCQIINLPKIKNRAGNITPIENSVEIPFEVKRIFYLYDIPGGANRGAHAHKECHQFLVAASGSFEVELDDGKANKIIMLNQSCEGLYIPPGIWAAEVNFSSGAICLVLASHKYNEKDYLRKYGDFTKFKLEQDSI